MNLGLYEIMDRISIIQNNLSDFVEGHEECSDEVKEHLSNAQCYLYAAYKVATEDFNNDLEGGE